MKTAGIRKIRQNGVSHRRQASEAIQKRTTQQNRERTTEMWTNTVREEIETEIMIETAIVIVIGFANVVERGIEIETEANKVTVAVAMITITSLQIDVEAEAEVAVVHFREIHHVARVNIAAVIEKTIEIDR